MNRRLKTELAIIILFTLAITIPFINKAFHIDDYLYIEGGNRYNEVFQSKSSFLYGVITQKIKSYGEERTVKPTHAFLPYIYTGALIAVSGKPIESVLHIGSIFFALLSVIFMYLVSERFIKIPLLSTMLLFLSPMFLVVSHSIGADIPPLALLLISLYLYILGEDKGKITLILLSSIVSCLCWLWAYQGLFLLPLFFCYSLVKGKNLKNSLIAASIPAALLLILTICYKSQIGRIPILEAWQWVGEHNTKSQILIGNISSIGSCTIFPFSAIFLFLSRRKNRMYFPIVLVISIILVSILGKNYSLSSKIHLFIFLLTGLSILFMLLKMTIIRLIDSLEYRNNSPDEIFLLLWFWGFFVAAIIFLPKSSVRYLLPLLPPLVIIFVNEAYKTLSQFKIFIFPTIILTGLLGLSVAIGDYITANTYRSVQSKIKKEIIVPHTKVWFVAESDFRYYLSKEGYQYLLRKECNSLKPGDFVITPRYGMDYAHNFPIWKRVNLFKEISINSNWPTRTANFNIKTGFHNVSLGYLAYAFSTTELEHFDIFKVDREK